MFSLLRSAWSLASAFTVKENNIRLISCAWKDAGRFSSLMSLCVSRKEALVLGLAPSVRATWTCCPPSDTIVSREVEKVASVAVVKRLAGANAPLAPFLSPPV